MKDFVIPFVGALVATLVIWTLMPLLLTPLPIGDSIKGLIQLGVGIVVCVLTFDFIRKKLGGG